MLMLGRESERQYWREYEHLHRIRARMRAPILLRSHSRGPVNERLKRLVKGPQVSSLCQLDSTMNLFYLLTLR